MTRSVAFLMRSSYGAFSHEDVLNLTWRQFETYMDAFTFLLRQETEEGRQANKKDDLYTLTQDDEVTDEREGIIEKARKYRNYTPKGEKKNLLE